MHQKQTNLENSPTNNQLIPTNISPAPGKVNDIGFRLILIPFFGIAIPLITGMTATISLNHWQLKFTYGYTILIAFLVWHGNRYLLFSMRSYFDWYNKPIKKIIALLLGISFYTIPVSTLLLTGWYYIFADGIVDWNVVFTSTLIIMICVIFITHVYETVFLVKESESEMVRTEQLEKAKMQAELEALKNQIDPHFIFNSLNTLSHLIEEKPESAKEFNDHLADVYRYILQSKGRELVLLREEIAFLEDYFSLLKIRFGEAIQLRLLVGQDSLDQYLIPPISLQLLVENAIKHNEFSLSSPVLIEIDLRTDIIFIRNNLQRKVLRKPTSRVGLYNLNERYRLSTGKKIEFAERENHFIVSIPVLKIH